MQKLIYYIKKFSSFTDSEIQTISKHTYIEKYKAKSFIHTAGSICKRIGFINNGVIRSYLYDTKGNELIHNFHTENQFAVDLLSYQKRIASNLYLQAITECELVFISKSSDEYLTSNIKEWPVLIRNISDAILAEKAENKTILLHADAKERYLSFIRKNPRIINVVPLGQIASYLGITQQSLSRIRKELII